MNNNKSFSKKKVRKMRTFFLSIGNNLYFGHHPEIEV